jgi:hypothetical protein
MQVRHSYPLPPPSAVLGFIHRIMGMKPGKTYKDEGETIKGLNVAILGRYGGIGWDYQWFLSPQKKDDENILYTSSLSPLKGVKFKQIPVKVQLLIDVNLLIYVKIDLEIYKKETRIEVKNKLKWENEIKALDFMKKKILEPTETPYLGRAEDLVIIENSEIIELKKKEINELRNYSAWIPREIAENFDLFGPVYNLPVYYSKKEIEVKEKNKIQKWWIRDFEFCPCVYAEPQEIGLTKDLERVKSLFDDKLKLPVWFLINNRGDKKWKYGRKVTEKL